MSSEVKLPDEQCPHCERVGGVLWYGEHPVKGDRLHCDLCGAQWWEGSE